MIYKYKISRQKKTNKKNKSNLSLKLFVFYQAILKLFNYNF